jgi:diguanylate cyclase (GGDEF)-like protein/PAS domain S-box-containing protein
MNSELAELQARQSASNVRVLVVDDEARMLGSLEVLLKYKGYQVETALGGKLACQKFQKNHYDLVMLDLNMGDFDGFAVLAFIADQGINTATVVVSGETSFDSVRKALRLGALDYVKKPYSPEELFSAIDSTLDKKHQRVDGFGAIVTDRSEQKATKERQWKSNDLFSKAESMSNIGHFFWDHKVSKILSCSDQYARIYGMTVSEVLEYFNSTEAEIDLIHPDDKAYYRQALVDSHEQSKVFEGEYRIITSSGDTRNVYERSELVFDNDGEPSQSFGTIQDITESKRLSDEKDRYNILAQEAPIGIVFNKSDGIAYYANKALTDITGFSNKQLTGDLWDKQLHPEDRERVKKKWLENITSVEPWVDEFRFQRPDGSIAWVEANTNPQLDNLGKVVAHVGTFMDITTRKQVEVKLHESEQRFSSLVHSQSDLICRLTADGTLTFVNDSYISFLGNGKSELLGHSIYQYIPPNEREIVKVNLSQLSVEEPRKTHENSMVSAAGERRIIEWIDHGIFDSNRSLIEIQSVGRDVTAIRDSQNELLQAYEKLERIAHYDVLTNLPNRVLLADRLSHAMVQCQRRGEVLAVAYLDLDGFKAVNDTHGHSVGDELLIAVSEYMKEALRGGDTLARIGGDEFIAIMVDLEKVEDSDLVLERLLRATAQPVTLGDVVMQVSVSIGVTFYPQDGADADQLIRHADQAMYVAKRAGKNRYHVFDVEQYI